MTCDIFMTTMSRIDFVGGNSDVLDIYYYFFFITIVFYNFFFLFMERCTQISRLRDNKVLLYCIVL